ALIEQLVLGRGVDRFGPRRADRERQIRLRKLAAPQLVLDQRVAVVVERFDVAHRSEEHTSELQSQSNLVCRLLLEKKKKRENENADSISKLQGEHTTEAQQSASLSSK